MGSKARRKASTLQRSAPARPSADPGGDKSSSSAPPPFFAPPRPATPGIYICSQRYLSLTFVNSFPFFFHSTILQDKIPCVHLYTTKAAPPFPSTERSLSLWLGLCDRPFFLWAAFFSSVSLSQRALQGPNRNHHHFRSRRRRGVSFGFPGRDLELPRPIHLNLSPLLLDGWWSPRPHPQHTQQKASWHFKTDLAKVSHCQCRRSRNRLILRSVPFSRHSTLA